ncbi:protein yellow-like isoform X2 [Planococcus citri]
MVPYYVILKYHRLLLVLQILYILLQRNISGVLAQLPPPPPSAHSKLHLLHQWKVADFTFPSLQARDTALRTGKYIPENCLILDVDVWQNPPEVREKIFVVDNNNNNNGHNSNNIYKSPAKRRVFVTLPRFKSGVPVTVATVTNTKRGDTTLLAPFPNWSTQREDNCETGITSVYRTKVDKCGVLWILDSGRVENFSPNPRKLCPPKVLAYDLNNGDKLIGRYEIPQDVLDPDSLLVTIAIDTRDTLCTDPYLYIADVTAFKLIVYDVEKNRSWRIGSNYFYPFPLYGNFNVAGTTFNLMDGILALALGPVHNGDRRLYFHSLASVREGSVPASVIRNQSLFTDDADSSWHRFIISESARPSQSASEDMSSTGILFFGLLSQMALACWNSRTPFTPENIHIAQQDNETLQFPSGIKIFGDTIYILTSELQNFIAGTTRANDVKYRILVGSVSDLVRGTGCDQRKHVATSTIDYTNPKWNVDLKNFEDEISPLQWEPKKVSHKHDYFWKQQRHNIEPTLPKFPRSYKVVPQPNPIWWSYDCRFYSGIHALCTFLGPSLFVQRSSHINNKK